MNRFSMWMANFMRGRYGMDQFNRFLLIAALIIIVADMFFRIRILDLLTIAILIYTYCRMFSRNHAARYRENQKFLSMVSRFRRGGAFSGGSRAGGADSSHRIMRCPGCGEKLRVPRGVGKIVITCPHCGTKFTKKV